MKLIVNRKKRSIGALFLAFVYLLISFHWILPFVAFSLNQQYIEDNLCKNVEVVELDCHGKCYLSEKIIEPLGEDQEKEPINLAQLLKFDYPVHTVVEKSFKLYQSTSLFTMGETPLASLWTTSPPTPPPRFV